MRLGSGEDDDNLNDDSERRRRMDGIFSNNENGNRNKKFIVFLDDIGNADILEQYLYKYEKLPDSKTLNNLEKKLFQDKLKNKKIYALLEKTKNKLSNSNITFIARSELFCNYSEQKCPLIKSNNLIYTNQSHLTNNGSKYFSTKGNLILEKLLNN